MPTLFDPLTIRGVTLRNRICMAPMLQCSAEKGFANDWHLVHLGSRAAGGAALVMTEAVAVEPLGRIGQSDLGIWDDAHVAGLNRITDFVHSQGAIAGIQIAHAGRKASYALPFDSSGPVPLRFLPLGNGGWNPQGPSAIAFDKEAPLPAEMDKGDIDRVIGAFADAASRAKAAGFRWVELHAAHGYLMHAFCSPVSNTRKDMYGGTFENRTRLMRQIVRAVRNSLDEDQVLAVRISYTDWVHGGWRLEDSIKLMRFLESDGVDVIDVSSGGSTPAQQVLLQEMMDLSKQPDRKVAQIPVGPCYQVPGAAAVKQACNMYVGAVGLITEARQADDIIRDGKADLIYLGRALLRDPYWPLRAAVELGETARTRLPAQYYLGWNGYERFAYSPVSAPHQT